MLCLKYRAYPGWDDFKIDDFINFKSGSFNGVFDTGYNGFGQIKSGNPKVSIANYELQSLKDFRDYVLSVKAHDGWIEDFVMSNPKSYKMLEEEYRNIPKDNVSYEKNGLNEEAIILFTNCVRLLYPDNGLVQKLFGCNSENGMYLLMPNALFEMKSNRDICYEYEVLQSNNLGNRLILSKMNRNI